VKADKLNPRVPPFSNSNFLSRAPVAHACNPNHSGGSLLEASPGKCSQDPISENTQHKRAGEVTQMVEHLPSKCEALSSNASTAKKYIAISEGCIKCSQKSFCCCCFKDSYLEIKDNFLDERRKSYPLSHYPAGTTINIFLDAL
jgi:hypothetical protein